MSIVSRGDTLIHRKSVWWTDDGQFRSFPALIGETATINCLVNMRAANELLADCAKTNFPLSVHQ